MLKELQASLQDKGITLSYDEKLLEWLTEQSYSITYGARNLRRTIQKELEDPLATQIIDSYDHPVSQARVTVEDGKIKVYTM